MLTGKYRTGTPADSRGASDMSQWVEGYRDEASSAVVEAVVKAAEGLGWKPLEVVLAWVRDQPGVTAPIVGARTAAQLRQALAVEEKMLPLSSWRHSTTSRRGARELRLSSSRAPGQRPGREVEWEFDKVTFSREFPRTVVTKLLVERAEHGGWELDRVRIGADGTRRIVLRRKIIRAVRTA